MKKRWLWGLGILGGAALTLAGLWLMVFRVNEFSLDIRLRGDSQVTLEYGQHYAEPGAEASLRGSLLLKQGWSPEEVRWTTDSDLDEERLGTYTVTYTAAYRDYTAQARRQVTVVDTQRPVITLTEDGPLEPEVRYEEAGFSAWDNYDGDITDRVERYETLGLVTYAVMDSSGNWGYASREIPPYDGQPPAVTLEGGTPYAIPLGVPYEEPGFTAVDNYDGDVTDAVEVSGEVCWYRRGTYPITYTVRDDFGNEAVYERLVEVTPAPRPKVVQPPGKTIFLTFDDGPSSHTRQLLDVLDAYGVKATFFVTGGGDPDILTEIVSRGHAIGIHTLSHEYGEIYASPEAYFDDLYGMQAYILEKTGVKTTLMRFPGGSSNTVSRKSWEGLMTLLTEAVQDAGFQYFDWNIYSGDAGGAGATKKASGVAENVIRGMEEEGTGIVLQHDIHGFSVEAVEDILIWGLNNGYHFDRLTENSPGYHHPVNN
ncbi:MAG: polysaccharide deacetylase family protein [Eubacteriales bacterium]|nr:polysaccharide deacetylase family protein [Eubacteriales bacterium]